MRRIPNIVGTTVALAATAWIALSSASCGSQEVATIDAGRPLPEGTAAFPADTRVLIGVNVGRLGDSPVVTRLVRFVLGGDATLEKDLAGLLARCGIEPRRDVDRILVGMGADRTQVGVLVSGRFQDAKLDQCMREAMIEVGGSDEKKTVAGRTVHLLRNARTSTTTWVATGLGRAVLVALDEAWLRRMLDPAEPKLPSQAGTMALVGRVDPDASIWGAGWLAPDVGGRIAAATQGAVKQPPVSMTGELRVTGSLAANLKLDMADPVDASSLADFARTQHAFLALGAQKYGLGRVVGKLAVIPDGKVVTMAIDLDPDDLLKIGEALDKLEQ
jgi:hypothetical protein